MRRGVFGLVAASRSGGITTSCMPSVLGRTYARKTDEAEAAADMDDDERLFSMVKQKKTNLNDEELKLMTEMDGGEEGDGEEEGRARFLHPKRLKEMAADWKKRKILFATREIAANTELRKLVAQVGRPELVDRAMELATADAINNDQLEYMLAKLHGKNPPKWLDESVNVGDVRVGSMEHVDGDDYRDYAHTAQGRRSVPFERGLGEPTAKEREENARKFPEDREAKPITYDDGVKLHELTHVMDLGRHTKVTTGGRIFSYSAMIVTGNSHGTAGMAYARGESAQDAVQGALNLARKNAVTIHRWRDCSLGESVVGYFKKAGVRIRVGPPNSGYGGGPLMQQFFRTFGLTDVTGEFYGPSKSPRKRYTAAFRAVQSAQRPDNIARKLGLKYFNPDRIWRRDNRIWSLD